MIMKRVLVYCLVLVGSAAPGVALADVLNDVKARGMVRCGVNEGLPGFAVRSGDAWQGFDVDMCRAVAAAVLGDADKVAYVPQTVGNRFNNLATGEVDLLARNTTWTLQRDLDLGISFAAINFYDGQGLMTRAEHPAISTLELDGARVCVTAGTTSETSIEAYFVLNRMQLTKVASANGDESLAKLLSGECDAMTSDQSQLYALRSVAEDPSALRVLPEVISREPLALAVREGEDRWRKIVQWTLWVMIEAEHLGIGQQNVTRIRDQAKREAVLRLFGVKGGFGATVGLPPEWAYEVIRQVGNYGEIFNRNLGEDSPLRMKRGLNAQWLQGGLLYAPPLR